MTAPDTLQRERDRFMAAFRVFMSEHLDHHYSAETTIELECAALITMLEVGRTSERQILWLDTLAIVAEYATKAGREPGAHLRALYRLADNHNARVRES